MLLTYKGSETVIDQKKSSVKLTVNADSVSIAYDGLDFIVIAVTGFVLCNNRQLKVGLETQTATSGIGCRLRQMLPTLR
jgi:hypothetical protein